MTNANNHNPETNHSPSTVGALGGATMITTYPAKEEDELAELLTAEGATVFSMPVIEVSPLPFQLKNEITTYDWLVFTSKNAVQPFVSQFPQIKNKVAALGDQTALRLKQSLVDVTFTGSGKSGEDFALEFLPVLQKNESLLLVLGNLAPDILQQKFSEKAQVERVNVYQTVPCRQVNEGLLNRIKHGQYDALIVTSPSAIKNLVRLLNNPQQQLKIISIGKTTTQAILQFNIQPLATSAEAGYHALAQTTIDYFKNRK